MKHLLLTVSLLIVLFSCSYGQRKANNAAMQKVNTVMLAIENLYVDTVNTDKLAEDAIIALLEKLDPHSSYSTPEEMKQLNEPLQGNFDGIGVQFNMLTDTVYIVQVIPGGPSEKVGIQAGDRIIYVNDTLIAGAKMQQTDVVKRLRGEKGSIVMLKVLRKGQPELLEFKVVRDKIPIYSLDTYYMIDKETGYIKLNRFGATTYDEFKTALNELKKKGLKSLILDLQGNGGGYMKPATDIADDFLDSGNLIVYTEGANQLRQESKAGMKGNFRKGKLIVLVDESSASASEILSGAIQDWDRGVIVGRRTFGKGLVQRPIELADHSMIRLTTARYYTPTGRSIQKPYEKGDLTSYNKDLIERYNHGEMITADSIHFPDSLKYNTLKAGRTVYGGGGIMPDYFVPLDTARLSDVHRAINRNGLINRLVMNDMETNRQQYLDRYKTFEDFYKNFTVTSAMQEELLNMYRKEVQKNEPSEDEEAKEEQTRKSDATIREEFNSSLPIINIQIKAYLASDLYERGQYYQIINELNDPLKKAIEIMNTPGEYERVLSRK